MIFSEHPPYDPGTAQYKAHFEIRHSVAPGLAMLNIGQTTISPPFIATIQQSGGKTCKKGGANMTLEDRVTALEKEIAELKRQLGNRPEDVTRLSKRFWEIVDETFQKEFLPKDIPETVHVHGAELHYKK